MEYLNGWKDFFQCNTAVLITTKKKLKIFNAYIDQRKSNTQLFYNHISELNDSILKASEKSSNCSVYNIMYIKYDV